jgi:nucleotide-binding universal stress UspA family protein
VKLEFKRILVPLDFSENARAAQLAADAIAAKFGAEIALLHVVENAPYQAFVERGRLGSEPLQQTLADAVPGSQTSVLIKDLVEEAKKRLAEYGGKRKPPYRTSVRQGHAVEEILGEIDDYKADLVVICTHGWTGLKHLMLGSVAEKVVRFSPVPVLTVKAEADS